jgi:hypothetical protein
MALMRLSKSEMLLSNTRSGLREFHLLQESNGNYKLSSQLAQRCGDLATNVGIYQSPFFGFAGDSIHCGRTFINFCGGGDIFTANNSWRPGPFWSAEMAHLSTAADSFAAAQRKVLGGNVSSS